MDSNKQNTIEKSKVQELANSSTRETPTLDIKKTIGLSVGAIAAFAISLVFPVAALILLPVFTFVSILLFIQRAFIPFAATCVLLLLIPALFWGEPLLFTIAVMCIFAIPATIIALNQKHHIAGALIVIAVCAIAAAITTTAFWDGHFRQNPALHTPEHFTQTYILSNAERPDIIALSNVYVGLFANREFVITSRNEGLSNVEIFAASSYNSGDILLTIVLGYAALIALALFLAMLFLHKKFIKNLTESAFEKEEKEKERIKNLSVDTKDSELTDTVFMSNLNLQNDFDERKKRLLKIVCRAEEFNKQQTFKPKKMPADIIKQKPIDICHVELGRLYMLFVFLPIFLFSLIASIASNAATHINIRFISNALFQTFIVVPAFFAGLSLFIYWIKKVRYKNFRGILYGAVALLTIVAILFRWVMFAIAVIALADALLNSRKHYKNHILKQELKKQMEEENSNESNPF